MSVRWKIRLEQLHAPKFGEHRPAALVWMVYRIEHGTRTQAAMFPRARGLASVHTWARRQCAREFGGGV